jgi:hypothetical protein
MSPLRCLVLHLLRSPALILRASSVLVLVSRFVKKPRVCPQLSWPLHRALDEGLRFWSLWETCGGKRISEIVEKCKCGNHQKNETRKCCFGLTHKIFLKSYAKLGGARNRDCSQTTAPCWMYPTAGSHAVLATYRYFVVR